MDLYAVFNGALEDNRRKIQVFLSTMITYFDIKHLRFDRITDILASTVATHKQSLLFLGHSTLIMSIRTLIQIH